MNNTPNRKKRISAACCFIALLAVEILIGKYGGGFVRDYLGDVLVIPLLYCFVRVCYVRPAPWLPAAVGGLGILAEVIQYLNFCDRFGIDRGSLLGILLGSVADWRDVICYAMGTVLIYSAEHFSRKQQRHCRKEGT